MQSGVRGRTHKFLAQSDMLIPVRQATACHVPIGRELFHSRPYGPLFNLTIEDTETYVSEEQSEPLHMHGANFAKVDPIWR